MKASDLARLGLVLRPTLSGKYPGVSFDSPGLSAEECDERDRAADVSRWNVLVGRTDIGLRSGIVDVETDGPGGEAALTALLGTFPAGPYMVVPPEHSAHGGSTHRLYRLAVPEGHEVNFGAGLLHHVDVPGQFLAIDGDKRIWHDVDQPIPDAPEALRKLLIRPQPRRSKVDAGTWEGDGDGTLAALAFLEGQCERYVEAADGERNDTLFKAARWAAELVAGGTLDADYARQRLDTAAMEGGLEYDEADEAVESGWRMGEANPRRLTEDTHHLIPKRRLGGRSEPESLTWRELKAREWPPPGWVVPGIVPDGLTVLAGKRKIGKSWLVGQMACAAAAGVPFLDAEMGAGDVLYLALEDPLRRLAHRLPAPPTPEAGERLTLQRVAPRLDQGLVDQLDKWRLGCGAPKLVIVDTLGLVRPPRNGGGSSDGGYEDSYADIRQLKGWADETGVAVIVIHHARKGRDDDTEDGDPLDLVLGSSGIVSAADTILVLQRGHEAEKGSLRGTGRDVGDITMWLRFDKDSCLWTKGSPTAKELVAQHGLEYNEARRLVTQMNKADNPEAVLASHLKLRAQGLAQGRAQGSAQPDESAGQGI